MVPRTKPSTTRNRRLYFFIKYIFIAVFKYYEYNNYSKCSWDILYYETRVAYNGAFYFWGNIVLSSLVKKYLNLHLPIYYGFPERKEGRLSIRVTKYSMFIFNSLLPLSINRLILTELK